MTALFIFPVSLYFARMKVQGYITVVRDNFRARTVFVFFSVVCLYWLISRCVFSREGASPDHPQLDKGGLGSCSVTSFGSVALNKQSQKLNATS